MAQSIKIVTKKRGLSALFSPKVKIIQSSKKQSNAKKTRTRKV